MSGSGECIDGQVDALIGDEAGNDQEKVFCLFSHLESLYIDGRIHHGALTAVAFVNSLLHILRIGEKEIDLLRLSSVAPSEERHECANHFSKNRISDFVLEVFVGIPEVAGRSVAVTHEAGAARFGDPFGKAAGTDPGEAVLRKSMAFKCERVEEEQLFVELQDSRDFLHPGT